MCGCWFCNHICITFVLVIPPLFDSSLGFYGQDRLYIEYDEVDEVVKEQFAKQNVCLSRKTVVWYPS